MGQGTSLPDPEQAFNTIHSKLRSNIGIFKKLAHLKHEEFLHSVQELNTITTSFCDRRGKQLMFFVEKGTDSSILWKTTVRICCQKVNSRRNMVESERHLNLKQFVVLYKEISDHISNLSSVPDYTPSSGQLSSLPSDICASVIFEGAEQIDDENECCICMENKSEVILPCAHEFCEGCIDTWNVTSKTCPICRARVESSDETWVLTEKPDNSEYESEVKGYLVSLGDKSGHKT